MSELSHEIESKFRTTSKRSAIISLIGAAVTIVGLLFAGYGAISESRKAETEARLAMERAQQLAEQAKRAEAERLAAERLREQLLRQEKAESLIWEGAELASRGLITEAIEKYNSAIELNPKNATVFQLKGYALLRRAQIKSDSHASDLKDAIQSLEKSTFIDPQNTWGYYNLALAYWEDGRRDEAIDSLRHLLSLDSRFKSVISNDVQFNKFRSSKDFLSLMKNG